MFFAKQVFFSFFLTQSVLVAFAEKIGVCILPPYPKNGHYTVEGNTTARPGEVMNSYVLKVICENGYHLVGEHPVCLQGWDTVLPECLPSCKWKSRSTLSCGALDTCYYQPLSSVDGLSPRLLDDDVCGVVSSPTAEVISGGKPSQKMELPWHVGVYAKTYSPYKQICGGSLVSSTVVISAAHCFWDDVLKALPAENYTVAVGKIYRPWNDPHDKHVQKSDVQEIHIPPRFLGSAANFQEDLALLVLTTPVTFTNAVRPVCLDFDYQFDSQQLTRGALGKVGGWGLRGQDGQASQTLQVALIPYINIAECVADSEPAFRVFLTGDKICAGYTNGTAVCSGDSGGGLSFPYDTDYGLRWYLRGVVSSAPRSEHLCSVFNWATFTHIQRHQHFIQTVLNAQPQTMPQTTDETYTLED